MSSIEWLAFKEKVVVRKDRNGAETRFVERTKLGSVFAGDLQTATARAPLGTSKVVSVASLRVSDGHDMMSMPVGVPRRVSVYEPKKETRNAFL
jgi:hypothetical protein